MGKPQSDMTGEERLEWVRRLLIESHARKVHGKLIIYLEDGEIQRAVKEESIRLPRQKT